MHRNLPFAQRRMVGPFIFLDHMGPAHFAANEGINVRPHPHIGLATVTYLFEGDILHRDSIGSNQIITPGAVNWMTAGRGIAHSGTYIARRPRKAAQCAWITKLGRVAEGSRRQRARIFPSPGGQFAERYTNGRSFTRDRGRGVRPARAGQTLQPAILCRGAYGRRLGFGAAAAISRTRGMYVIAGDVKVGGTAVAPLTMAVLSTGDTVRIEAASPSHIVMLGGEPLPEPRYIEWNFVSSDPEKIAAAKDAWRAQTFAKIPGRIRKNLFRCP